MFGCQQQVRPPEPAGVRVAGGHDSGLDEGVAGILSYDWVVAEDGETKTTSFDVRLRHGQVQIALRSGPRDTRSTDAKTGEHAVERSWGRADDALPGLTKVFEAVPLGPVRAGVAWIRHQPPRMEAASGSMAARPSVCEFEVSREWKTREGTVARVRVEGYVLDTVVRGRDRSLWKRPEHVGYVDVNLATNTIVDALLHVDVNAHRAQAPSVDAPRIQVMRLCPSPGAHITGRPDTCGERLDEGEEPSS